ncbi:ATP-binding protein [Pseudoalteromonas sp. YIC-656]|uniref:ATP-binding protein n=1 Tax=Pseudoalteromonas pernae TaxID=3118054 RepID=UPI003242305A
MTYNRSSAIAKTNLTLLGALVIVTVLFTLAIVAFESRVKNSVLEDTQAHLTDTTSQMRELVHNTIANAHADLRFLHATPPISGLPRAHYNDGIDPYDGTEYNQWKNRLETIFTAFMQNKASVDQLRVISSVGEGKELIRVERRGGLIEAVPDYGLQVKRNSTYFLPSSQLMANQVYMSRLNLNRENGKIEFPYRPVIRYSIPMFAVDGRRFGFLIMNVNASNLLAELAQSVPDFGELVITAAEEDIIYHPQEAYRFTRDTAPEINWGSLYKPPIKNDSIYVVESQLDAQKKWYVLSSQVVTRNTEESGYINLNVFVPESYVFDIINEKRITVYSFLIAALSITAIVMFNFHRSAVRSQLLAEARRESSAIVEGSIDAIISLDMAGRLTTMNHAAEVLLGSTVNVSKGLHFEQIGFLKHLPISTYTQALSHSAQRVTDDWHTTTDDVERFYAISVSPMRAEQNQLDGIALIIRDITKEKQADKSIRKLNADLDQKVRVRTEQLAHAKDEAQKASEVKSAFISNISHEMRTPLNGIIGTLGLLKREKHSEKSTRFLEMMELSATNLNVLINDILDLSKIEAGKLEINPKPFNPVALIESVVVSSAVKAFDKNLEVFVDTKELHCQEVITDPHRFTQIINNLISNAIKFTEYGHVKITAKGEVVNNSQYELSVSVADTGVGIAEESQGKLFSAFTQANSGVAAKYGGTGLGLSICRQLSQLLNGDIRFKSQLNQGSEFTCHITLSLGCVKLRGHSKQLSAFRALIFTDNLALTLHLREVLVFDGAQVQSCELAQIDASSLSTYDMIFIDSKDQGVERLETILSKHPKLKLPPVVALQSASCPVVNSKVIRTLKLNKPIIRSELLRMIADPEQAKAISSHANITDNNAITPPEKIKKLVGKTVLIVDDNDINIEVAVGMLSSLPVDFVRANNGQEAIDVLNHLNERGIVVSCVLMDCQMPILNGYDTTMKIRSGAAGMHNSHVPIIAMTANALLGEKEKCLAAGMNDYVSKPLVVEEAEVKVVRWILSYSDSDTDTNTEQSKSVGANNPVELWDRDAALKRLLNKEDLLNKICAMFVKTAPNKMAILEEAVASGEYDSVRQAAHAFKGLCGEISAVPLHSLLAQIEDAASNNSLAVEPQLKALRAYVPQLIEEVEVELAQSE